MYVDVYIIIFTGMYVYIYISCFYNLNIDIFHIMLLRVKIKEIRIHYSSKPTLV